MITKLGYLDQPLDSADGVILKRDYLLYIYQHDPSPTRWNRLRTEGSNAYRFWYRQSPRYFETFEEISVSNPAMDVSGMTTVYLDMAGRLRWFVGVPPQREPAAGDKQTPDWSIPFREAGLDMANFQPVASTSVPLHAYDARAAWDGFEPAHPELKTHVEAAAFHGKLIYFETVYPWDQPTRQEQPQQTTGDRVLTSTLIAVYLSALVGGTMLARRNLRLGRGDLRGATRLALAFFILRLPLWLFAQHHNGLPASEFELLVRSLAIGLFNSCFLGVLYLALEPFVRKRWPRRIISWNRLLAGGYRDPLVGRDALLGAVFGGGLVLLSVLGPIVQKWIGRPPVLAVTPGSEFLGVNLFLAFVSQLTAALFIALITLFLLLLFVFVLRREWLALFVLWILLAFIQVLLFGVVLATVPLVSVLALLAIAVLYRYGLLASIAAMFVWHLWVFYPMTTELTAWYATGFTIALAICVAVVAYGFYTSLAGQSLFSGKLLED